MRLSDTGFHYLQPKVGAMARMRAVNEVRLQIGRRRPSLAPAPDPRKPRPELGLLTPLGWARGVP